MGRCVYLLSFIVLVLAVITAVIDMNREQFYVFDPDVLHKVAAETAKMNITAAEKISRITHELHKIYPQYIDVEEEWMFNVAGGAMGHMTLLHCSITEYVIIFGSPIGTEGFSGRFLSDDYFTIIEGEQHSYYAGEIQARVFKPGDRNLMPRGTATGYRMPVPTYALGTSFSPFLLHNPHYFYSNNYPITSANLFIPFLTHSEYARGNIPTMLPFGFADTLSSTVDFLSLWQTVYHYGRITINQLLIGKI